MNDFNTDIIPHTDVVAIGAEVSKEVNKCVVVNKNVEIWY